MNPWLGWALAAAALAAGWFSYGWRGMILAATLIAFWLLLQFNRVVRVMRTAADSPMGEVPNAVMLQSKLEVGQPMVEIVKMTKSLGKRAEGEADVFTWTDTGGAAVTITFVNGRCTQWTLKRPDEP